VLVESLRLLLPWPLFLSISSAEELEEDFPEPLQANKKFKYQNDWMLWREREKARVPHRCCV